MPVTVSVSGSSQIDELKRKKAVEKVLELTTDELERLVSLVDSEKARSYLKSPIKFAALKALAFK